MNPVNPGFLGDWASDGASTVLPMPPPFPDILRDVREGVLHGRRGTRLRRRTLGQRWVHHVVGMFSSLNIVLVFLDDAIFEIGDIDYGDLLMTYSAP